MLVAAGRRMPTARCHSRPLMTGFFEWMRHSITPRSSDRLALLIDADNTSWKTVGDIMDEASRHGNPIARRCYGDFTTPQLVNWKQPMADHAILPQQSFNNTAGKNNSDSTMIIDAMELLHSGRFDVFCLVSSDADFTSLAIRIREEGRTVIGIGRSQTPQSFVKACHTFVEVETLQAAATMVDPALALTPGDVSSNPVPKELNLLHTSVPQSERPRLKLLHTIILETTGEDGWATVSRVGDLLTLRCPAFDSRKLGARNNKLGTLLSALDIYETKRVGSVLKVRPRPNWPSSL